MSTYSANNVVLLIGGVDMSHLIDMRHLIDMSHLIETVGLRNHRPNIVIIDRENVSTMADNVPEFTLHVNPKIGDCIGYISQDTPDGTKKRRNLSMSDGLPVSNRPDGWYNKFNKGNR